MGATGCWNIDMARAARETLPDYLDLSYYEIWLGGLEKLLVATGLVGADELAAGRALHPSKPVARILKADRVAAQLAQGSPTERAPAAPARFSIGQRVATRRAPVDHHTRMPAYLRGRTGTVERVLGPHVFADSQARGLGEDPQWLYTVVFDENRDIACPSTHGNPISSPRERRPTHSRTAPVFPVFEEPWQAHAFAMTVSLHERGVFTWSEWSHALSQEISPAAARGTTTFTG